MRTFVSHLALLLEDEEQEIIDIRRTAPSPIFFELLFGGGASSPFLL